MTIAERSLDLTGLFEAEVLTELLLRRWTHPFADDEEFRNDLLESAAEALRGAVNGQRLFDDLPADETNLIAAIFYAEWSAVMSGDEDPKGGRRRWLDQFQGSIPSCFHPQEDLPP